MLFSCSASKDKGAIIAVNLGEELRSYDPAKAFTDKNAAQFFELVFEGLFDISSSGKVSKALAKSYKVIEDGDEKILEITLKDTSWNDGRQVAANDIIYAWKRILDPETTSEAAALLYDIKNAREAKAGTVSIDDVGILAVGTKVLQIIFVNKNVDVDLFLETLASPALVPLREDMISKSANWDIDASYISCNGPFYVKTIDSTAAGKDLVLERNIYFNTTVEKETKYNKYVKPNRLIVSFGASDKLTEKYNNTELFYLTNATGKKVKSEDLLSTYSYYFNTTKAPFDNANVRLALSTALDREYIASLSGKGSDAATGFIPTGIYDTKAKTSFRKKGGSLIATSANMDEAKSLLASSGVKNISIKITYRRGERNEAIADYVKGVWSQLGVNVTTEGLGATRFAATYESREFDVIAVDSQALTTSAYSMLAPFAYQLSGTKFDLTTKDVVYEPGATGYKSEEYNTLLVEALEASSRKDKAEKLHKAEEILISDMPCIPLVFNANSYATKKLSGIKYDIFGSAIFTKVKQSNYKKYLPTEEE